MEKKTFICKSCGKTKPEDENTYDNMCQMCFEKENKVFICDECESAFDLDFRANDGLCKLCSPDYCECSRCEEFYNYEEEIVFEQPEMEVCLCKHCYEWALENIEKLNGSDLWIKAIREHDSEIDLGYLEDGE